MKKKRRLTDLTIKALKPAGAGRREDHMDADVPGFGVRVTDRGHKTFIFASRIPGKPNYTRREIAAVGETTLAEARETAAAWRRMIAEGLDPAEEKKRKAAADAKAKVEADRNTFSSVFADFEREKLAGERKGREVAGSLRSSFIQSGSAEWGGRPLTEIREDDIRDFIRRKKVTAPAQARNLLGYLRRMFAWAIDQRCYGLTSNPCREIRSANVLGSKISRERILTDDETFAVHRAAKRLPYPHGPMYQLLLLTALRLNEGADARWREFDFKNGICVIPADRMKGKNGRAREHVVPLTVDMISLLEGLPRFRRGDFVFSTTFGEKPAWLSSKVKARLDRRILRTLRALARIRGEDVSKVELVPFVNHDLRRTIRSGLSALRIDRDIREAVLAHTRRGVEGVYDRYDYLIEKKDALERWAERLRSLADLSPPSNVVPMHRSAGWL